MVLQQGLPCLPVVDAVRLGIIAQQVQLALLKFYAHLDYTALKALVPLLHALQDHIVQKVLVSPYSAHLVHLVEQDYLKIVIALVIVSLDIIALWKVQLPLLKTYALRDLTAVQLMLCCALVVHMVLEEAFPPLSVVDNVGLDIIAQQVQLALLKTYALRDLTARQVLLITYCALTVDMVLQQGLPQVPVVDSVRLDIIAQQVQLALLKTYALRDLTARQVGALFLLPYCALVVHMVLQQVLPQVPVVDAVRLDIIAQQVQLALLKTYALLDLTVQQVLLLP